MFDLFMLDCINLSRNELNILVNVYLVHEPYSGSSRGTAARLSYATPFLSSSGSWAPAWQCRLAE